MHPYTCKDTRPRVVGAWVALLLCCSSMQDVHMQSTCSAVVLVTLRHRKGYKVSWRQRQTQLGWLRLLAVKAC